MGIKNLFPEEFSEEIVKSPKARSESALTAAYLKEHGWIADKTEQVVPYRFIKKDLFGFGDFLAFKPDLIGSVIVQATSRHNVQARVKKILSIKISQQWLKAGNGIVVFGWDRPDGRWRLKVVPVEVS